MEIVAYNDASIDHQRPVYVVNEYRREIYDTATFDVINRRSRPSARERTTTASVYRVEL